MTAAFCVVVPIGMYMRVCNGSSMDNMGMRKQSHTCIVVYQDHYEKVWYYFLYPCHKIHFTNSYCIIKQGQS